jgi:hypothetical protein
MTANGARFNAKPEMISISFPPKDGYALRLQATISYLHAWMTRLWAQSVGR